MTILALDQSTQVTGYSVFNNGKLVEHGQISYKHQNPIVRISKLVKWLLDKILEVTPDIVAVEDTHLENKGFTNVQVLKLLTKLLGILEFELFKLNITCSIVNTSEWRATCGIKGKDRAEKKKNTQFFVLDTFGINVSEDVADAICIGYHVSRKVN